MERVCGSRTRKLVLGRRYVCVCLSTWKTERRLTLCFQTRTIRERESKECVIDEAGLKIDTKMAVFRR